MSPPMPFVCLVLTHSSGASGRWVAPEGSDQPPTSTTHGLDATESGRDDYSTAQEPRVPIDLSHLIDLQKHHDSVSPASQTSPQVSGVTTVALDDKSPVEDASKASYVGESWYANYVISRSAVNHAELHRPLDRRSSGPSPGTVQTVTASQKRSKSDFPPQNLIEHLVEAYFTRFHVYCPILDKPKFLQTLAEQTVSTTLLRCVLFVASIHCESNLYHALGHSSRLEATDDLFRKACAAFDAETEDDRTTMILSSYLLHYWFGKPTKYRDSLWWLASAIRSAQCMGYHRSTTHSKLNAQEKSYFKVLWWCLYIRDRQLSLSIGAPMIINDLEYDVDDLTIDDFPFESAETTAYVMSQASLNRTVSSLYFRYCSPARADVGRAMIVKDDAIQATIRALEDWAHANPSLTTSNGKDPLNLILNVCYQ